MRSLYVLALALVFATCALAGESPRPGAGNPPLSAPPPSGGLDAFPGAEGHGKGAVGGRGGAVLIVDTLADSGPGSLRACVEATGPRTCVFRVSGSIRTLSPIRDRSGYLTIAGQTSPGGVEVRIDPDAPAGRGRGPLAFEGSRHVVVRHLRARPGFDAADRTYVRASNSGLLFTRADDWIVDHVSTGFTADQALTCFQGGERWTVQDSLFTLGLTGGQAHHFGPLLCGDQHRDATGPGTYLRNISHSMVRRNPNAKTTGADHGAIDVVNNLVSNPGEHGIAVWDDHPGTDGWGTVANIVGNVGWPGLMTRPCGALINDGDQTTAQNRLHIADNLIVPNPNNGRTQQLRLGGNQQQPCAASTASLSGTPLGGLSVVPMPASQVAAYVLDRAGAWPRDSVDAASIAEIRARNAPATHPASQTVWPSPAGPAAPPDGDDDGMPDAWETANGLDPGDPGDRNGIGRGGYTWLEVYLDERHREVMAAGP
jgi:hypothetical protein